MVPSSMLDVFIIDYFNGLSLSSRRDGLGIAFMG
jgi:hypothetical protein